MLIIDDRSNPNKWSDRIVIYPDLTLGAKPHTLAIAGCIEAVLEEAFEDQPRAGKIQINMSLRDRLTLPEADTHITALQVARDVAQRLERGEPVLIVDGAIVDLFDLAQRLRFSGRETLRDVVRRGYTAPGMSFLQHDLYPTNDAAEFTHKRQLHRAADMGILTRFYEGSKLGYLVTPTTIGVYQHICWTEKQPRSFHYDTHQR